MNVDAYLYLRLRRPLFTHLSSYASPEPYASLLRVPLDATFYGRQGRLSNLKRIAQ